MENNTNKSNKEEDQLNNSKKSPNKIQNENNMILNEESFPNKLYFCLRLSKPLKIIENNKINNKRYVNLTKRQKKITQEMKEKIQKDKKLKYLSISKSSNSNIYKNFLPIHVWYKCEQLYEENKNKYSHLIKYRNKLIKERKKQKSPENFKLDNFKDFTKNKEIILKRNTNIYNKYFSKSNTYSFKKLKLLKNCLTQKIDKNNYYKYLNNVNIRKKLINKGLNYFIEKTNKLINTNNNYINKNSLIDINISNIKNKENNNKALTDRKIFPYIYKNRNNSALIKKSNINMNNFYNVKNFNNYKIKVSFYSSLILKQLFKNKEKKNNDDITYIKNKNENNDNLLLKDLSNIIEDIKYSIFNYFYIENNFNIKTFHIIGITSAEGKNAIMLSRILKNLLLEYFTNKNYYYNYFNLSSKSIINKDLIYEILTSNSNMFIKNILYEIFKKLKNEGYKADDTKEYFYLIFLVGVNVISVKTGDILSYFIYESKNNNIKNIIIKEPFSDLEKEKYKNNFLIKNNNFSNINKLEIRMFKLDTLKNNNDINSNINIYAESFLNQNNINYNIDDGYINYIVIGNNSLFKYYKINYYVKYINEFINKHKQNQNNEKSNINFMNIAIKLLNDSIKNNINNYNDNNKENFISIILIE